MFVNRCFLTFPYLCGPVRRLAAILLRSFLQGLLLLSPIAITGFVLYSAFDKIDNILPFIPQRGVGFVIIIGVVTLIGYFGTRFIVGRWLFDAFEYVMEHTPGIKFLYSSIRDVIQSFVGDKKRFNKPVWVCTNVNPDIWRIGFLTQEDMSHFCMEGRVAVYLPHSYAISGWVIVTDKKNIKPVTEMTAGEAMKFAVSGGVTTAEDGDDAKKNKL
jgi:uncharacterized membrane protein